MGENLFEAIKEIVKVAVREVLEEQKPIENNNIGAVGLKKAAEFIGMSQSWIRKNQTKLNGYHEGTKLMFKTSDLQYYLDSKGSNKLRISTINTVKSNKSSFRKIV